MFPILGKVFRFPARAAGLISYVALTASSAGADQIQFNRDIRPILSDNCFFCHGPDANKREADLRLDVRDDAVEAEAITPGDPDESELIHRIFTTDEDDLMPPPESHKVLTTEQKELLREWIKGGAEYQKHWAYEPPARPEIPAEAEPIDHLVQARLANLDLQPSAEADRRTLARRLHFDLTGIPPTPEEVAAFENDSSEDAYAELVDRLIASPHFGERMAIGWLDVVRFADTIGYHSDVPRNIWPYRDYVINSFNDNKPFDVFTREQLAGDLLPNPSRETKVASAFNRLLLSTEEGGAQPKDYEARMLTDRVRAVGAVWLGQTTGCAQCHDHKFDPFTQRDFYSLGAFFADIEEPIIGRREPGMLLPSDEQAAKLDQLRRERDQLQASFDAPQPELDDALNEWIKAQREVLAKAEDSNDPKALPNEIQEALDSDSEDSRKKLLAHFKTVTPELADLREQLESAKKAFTTHEDSIARCLISISMDKPRTVRMLPRGNWMDESGEIVQPALPGYLTENLASPDRDLNRLDLAEWLISPDNPLTARVVMNRMWKQFFGIGLSKVLDDLGTQGEPPANGALLDWLACEFRDSGWDVKHMVRLMVNSSTYRQTSVASKDLLTRDPDNRLLARQSRWRIDAELVRDNALSIAGLLNLKIGGPSATPYQPEGYWENLNFPVRTYQADENANQYRRGLYTWWQRSYLHPSMLAFDAPTREECAADRPRSNIPQQALVLLNDPTYVEAARVFAARIIREGGTTVEDRVRWAWRQALMREPDKIERNSLSELLANHLADYTDDPESARALLKIGLREAPADIDAKELAAWTSVARVILNLHETVTRS